jgi:hypothetical protein
MITIKELIVSGTTIISDSWAAYNTLEEVGYTIMSVKHSISFVRKKQAPT